MVLVGFKGEKPFVIAIGHPDGSRIYSLIRIKGVDKPPPDVPLPALIKLKL